MGHTRRIVLMLGLAAALALVLPAVAYAKSFTMPAVSIEAKVNADGSMDVRERRTWDFSGDFTRVYWDLSASGVKDSGHDVQITDISIGEGGVTFPPTTAPADQRPARQSRVTPIPGGVRVEAYDTFKDQSRTFELAYKVRGAAVRWSDTAELYWQFVGSGWTEPTGRVDVTIRFPSSLGTDTVRAWAHGPLTGEVRVLEDGSVTLHVYRPAVGHIRGGPRPVPGRRPFGGDTRSAAAPRCGPCPGGRAVQRRERAARAGTGGGRGKQTLNDAGGRRGGGGGRRAPPGTRRGPRAVAPLRSRVPTGVPGASTCVRTRPGCSPVS